MTTFPWIISTDTLRPSHLIPAFRDAISHILNHPAPQKTCISDAQRSYARDLFARASEYGDKEEHLLDLQAILEYLAPSGYYFGAHDDDGACFGFWPAPIENYGEYFPINERHLVEWNGLAKTVRCSQCATWQDFYEGGECPICGSPEYAMGREIE